MDISVSRLYLQMVWWMNDDKFERIWKEAFVTPRKNLSHVSWCSGKVSNRAPPEEKSRLLPLHCSVRFVQVGFIAVLWFLWMWAVLSPSSGLKWVTRMGVHVWLISKTHGVEAAVQFRTIRQEILRNIMLFKGSTNKRAVFDQIPPLLTLPYWSGPAIDHHFYPPCLVENIYIYIYEHSPYSKPENGGTM